MQAFPRLTGPSHLFLLHTSLASSISHGTEIHDALLSQQRRWHVVGRFQTARSVCEARGWSSREYPLRLHLNTQQTYDSTIWSAVSVPTRHSVSRRTTRRAASQHSSAWPFVKTSQERLDKMLNRHNVAEIECQFVGRSSWYSCRTDTLEHLVLDKVVRHFHHHEPSWNHSQCFIRVL